MNKFSGIIIMTQIAFLAFSQTEALSQSRERSEIAAEHKWKLEDLYPSDQAWNPSRRSSPNSMK